MGKSCKSPNKTLELDKVYDYLFETWCNYWGVSQNRLFFSSSTNLFHSNCSFSVLIDNKMSQISEKHPLHFTRLDFTA